MEKNVKYYKAKSGLLRYYKVINGDFRYKSWVYVPAIKGDQKLVFAFVKPNQWNKSNIFSFATKDDLIEISKDDLTLEMI